MSFSYCQKDFFSPKIVCINYLINEGNFSITHTMMFLILNVSVNWRLFDDILFYEIPMGWLVIVEPWLKAFSTTCVLFWSCFACKKVHNISGTTGQVIVLNTILSLGTGKSKCFSSHNIIAYFAPSTSTWWNNLSSFQEMLLSLTQECLSNF